MNKRRRLLAGAVSALLAPGLASPQSGGVHHVGIMTIGGDPSNTSRWQPFFEQMRKLGYVEGRNLRITHAHGHGVPGSVPELVRRMLDARPDVIVTTGRREIQALKDVTSTIPIVMTFSYDPVAEGFVKSLAHPGGNITGLAFLVPGMPRKYVELLREVVPSAKTFALIGMAPNPTREAQREYVAAAKSFGIALLVAQPSRPEDFEAAIVGLKQQGAAGLIVPLDGGSIRYRSILIPLAIANRLPMIHGDPVPVEAGGLMSYTPSFPDQYRRTAFFVDKILKGAKPGDLPVEQPIRFELLVNLRTAKALGINFPQSILVRADRVIE